MSSQLVVIGNGKMLIDCSKILGGLGDAEIALVVTDGRDPQASRVEKACARLEVPFLGVDSLADPRLLDRLRALEPELLFNINSFWIFKEPLLSMSRRGIVNFHNGPLPRYRGVHIPTWALVNGERRHGVTWHLVEAGIDSGPILAQRHFDVDHDSTALDLTFRCIVEGTELLREVAGPIVRGELEPRPQEGPASYFSRSDIPNGGWIDFDAGAEQIARFVRAFDFGPFPSGLPPCRVRCEGGVFSVRAVELVAETPCREPPGTLLAIAGGLRVAVRDGVVRLTEIADADGEEVDARRLIAALGLREGQFLGAGRNRHGNAVRSRGR